MDIFLGTLYTLLERLPFGLLWSNTCLRDVYRTRRVLKCILEAHFMRSAVPILVILSLTHANKKYRINLVAYTFWHHYRTNFVETKVLFPLFWTKLWAPVSSQRPSPPLKNIPCAESELRYLESQHIHYVEAELWNFKSQNILCAEVELQVTEYFACGISLVPYAMARMTRVRRGHRLLGQSHLEGAVIYCSILAVAPTGIFVCFLRYYQAVTNQLTYDKDPDMRHTSWPKAAGAKLPTG